MKKNVLCIIIFLLSIFFYLNCNGDLLEEGAESESDTTSTTTLLEIKLRGIWLVGGLSGADHANVVGAVDMYDPVTDTWYPAITTLPTPVSFAGATSINISATDHRIYVFGGFDSTGTVMDTVQYYTIEADTWSTGANITNPRANINAVRLNNKIYIMGGTATDATTAFASQVTTYEYYPMGDSWDLMTNCTASSEKLMIVSGSVIYYMGGRTNYQTVSNIHYGLNLFRSATGTETSVTERVLSSARTGITGDMYESPDGPVMIIAGGFTALTTSNTTSIILGTTASTATNLVQYLAYPFAEGPAWTNATGTFSAIGFGSAVVYYSASLTPNYRFYFFGGTSLLTSAASGSTSASWSDLPQPPNVWNNTWTAVANMPTGRFSHIAVKIEQ